MPALERYSETENDLVTRLRSGDTTQFAALYDNYSALLYGVILKVVSNTEDAENLLQDCFVKIWRNIHNFDEAKGRFATWLINIARNTAIDYTRSKPYVQRQNVKDIDSFVANEASLGETVLSTDSIGLRQIVDILPPQHREIIEWMYFEGYTQQEIADNFDLPIGTVKTRARLALKALRSFFT